MRPFLTIEILTANPNPSQGDFNVAVKMVKKQILMLTITDIKGLEHYRKTWQNVDQLSTTINLSQEVAGTYFLRAITENDVRELKIILQK